MSGLPTGAAMLTLIALAVGCGDEEPGEGVIEEGGIRPAEVARLEDDAVETFGAEIKPVNDSHVRGEAQLALAGRHLTVGIDATGLQPGFVHHQAIHGFRGEGEVAKCPNVDPTRGEIRSERANRRFFGPSLLALEPFPTLRGSDELDYTLTFTVDTARLTPLEDRVIVLKGATARVPGDPRARFVPRRPVACGALVSTGD